MAHTIYNFDGIADLPDGRRGTLELAARLGYAAKGMVYATAGILALLAAAGFGSGKITGTRGAIETFSGEPWGVVLLVALAIGLAAFAVWRFTQAILDTEDKGSDAGGLIKRVGLFGSGVIYAWLGYYAVRVLMGSQDQASSTQDRVAAVMSSDGGVLLIGITAFVIFAIALRQIYRAVTAQFKENWKTARMSAREERIATAVSRFGIAARALAFVLIGVFFAWAALTTDPDAAHGLGGALSDVAGRTSGPWLIGLAGAGLLSYGAYCFVNALFRRIDAS